METLTITLDDAIAARARDAAAREGKSLSGYVADVVCDRVSPSHEPVTSQAESAKAFLALPRWDLTDENGRLPSRDEMYAERDEQIFHRHEHPALRD